VERFLGSDSLSLNSSLAGCSCFRLRSFRRRAYNASPRSRGAAYPNNGPPPPPSHPLESGAAGGAIPPRENEIISRLMASGIADIQPAIGCSPVAAVPPGSFVPRWDTASGWTRWRYDTVPEWLLNRYSAFFLARERRSENPLESDRNASRGDILRMTASSSVALSILFPCRDRVVGTGRIGEREKERECRKCNVIRARSMISIWRRLRIKARIKIPFEISSVSD